MTAKGRPPADASVDGSRIAIEPRVSAIISAYRRPVVVQEAIRSALAQTYPIHEVVVVDDASGDGTPNAVLSVGDPCVRLVRLETNAGPAGAMNAGIAAATGDVVALLDSDDLWVEHKIARQIAVWRARADRDRILLASRVHDEVDGAIVGVLPHRTMREDEAVADYLFVHDGMLQTGTMMLSRALALAVGLDAGTRRHTDPGFAMRLEVAGAKVVQFAEPLTRWRSTSGAQRVSTAANLDASLAWLERYRPMMSKRAAIGFRYRNHIRILRRTDPRAAAVLTVKAIAAGVLGWREVRRGWARLRARARA